MSIEVFCLYLQGQPNRSKYNHHQPIVKLETIMPLVLKRTKHSVKFFVEKLSSQVNLEMMLIPAGTFLMGSPENEIGRSSYESPQHSVNVPSFCMGKYPVTQEQWRVVAGLAVIDQELNPDLSFFKGDYHPVEQVSWFDAQEFCARLSLLTKREYRLPSEAEWEYACRGETTTPFHFGKTITTNLGNYNCTYYPNNDWSGSYDQEPKGVYRKKTTPVEMFPPNIFGLHDMHGNVFEWCLDHYHDDYEGAPTNGSAWIDSDADRDTLRVVRGGCWDVNPSYCRSAYRNVINIPVILNGYIGFRVVCEAARTL
jgi:formylglycine-generating enzyme required for sulfatase activity